MNGLPAGERWSVMLASRAVKELRKIHKDQNALEITWKKIRELSAGQFTSDNHAPIIGTTESIPIYRARLSNDLRIIYQIDLIPDSLSTYDHQVVKILFIGSRAKINYGFWSHVSSILCHRSNQNSYRERCLSRLQESPENSSHILPLKFPHDNKFFIHDPLPLSVLGSATEAKDLDEANAIIGLERFLPASKAVYNSIIANVELDFPFVLDPHEREIVNHRGASIVVGRSGTGKTTALIYKMRAIKQAVTALEEKEKRQLFVTRSPVLARHVESSFRGLVDSATIANKTPEELAEMAKIQENRPAPALVEFDSEVDLRKDLPARYSLLKEDHFPLFLSFERLCSLVEADMLKYEKLKLLWKQQYDISLTAEALELEREGRLVLAPTEDPLRDLLLQHQDRRLMRSIEEKKYICYSDFKERYWPQFKKIHQPEITPALVYSEILGVIKGSTESIICPKRYLSKAQYLSGLVRRVSAQLDLDTREQIYAIFEQYRKLSGASFELDLADRAHCLLDFITHINAIEVPDSESNHTSGSDVDFDADPNKPEDQEDIETGTNLLAEPFDPSHPRKLPDDLKAEKPTKEYYEGLIRKLASCYQKPVGHLYVDEVQDNLMVDIQLLSKLCKNVQNTYWGGDTAQTIVAGSAFRIKDLGAYLFKSNEPEEQHPDSDSRLTQFQLTVNFRSHNGIVQCAASIVQKLYELFPNSLDKLGPETGRSSGALPVIFSDASSDIFLFEQFLLKSSSGSNTMFGAQQAILVRSESVAEELSLVLSELCPVITIADSKGLEFEDILVYNFFSTSELPLDAWDFVHGHPLKTHRGRRESAPPPSLCNDLKLLYVALTRARKRCWIWDQGYVVDAMKKFWLSNDLVTTASISEITGWNTVASTPTQWIEKGREYFANGNYKLARGCFIRGGHKAEANVAEAYHQMSRAKLEAARHNPITESSKLNLCKAAEKLKSCAVGSDGRNAQNLWYHAGSCLELAAKINEASEAYVTAEQYEKAIRLLLEKNRYTRAVPILLNYQDKLDSELRKDWLDMCRVYYIERSAYDSLRSLFKDTDSLLTFINDRGSHSQYIGCLEHVQRFHQLAQIYLKQNSPVKALGCLLKEYNLRGGSNALNEAVQLVVSQAEWVLSFDRSRDQASANLLNELMQSLGPFTWRLTGRRQKELKLIQAILNNSLHLHMVDDWKAEALDERLWRARIYHSVLKDTTWLNGHFEPHIMQILDGWFDYLSILAPMVEATKPSGLAAAQRLFGFKPLNSESAISSKMTVADWSIIATAAKLGNVPTQQNQYGELLISSSWVDRLVKVELRMPLKKQLFEIYSGLKRSGWTAPIRLSPYSIPLSLRYASHARTSDGKFNTRVKFIAAAIQAFSPTCRIPCRGATPTSGLLIRWVRRLFDALYPANGTMEQSDLISPHSNSHFIEGVQTCVRELVAPSAMRISLSAGTSFPVGSPDISTRIVGYSLSLHLPRGLSMIPSDDAPEVAQYLAAFFNWNDPEGLIKGTLALRNVLKAGDNPHDAAVVVHFVEMITCDVIYHCRKTASCLKDGFSGLILPFSWARCLAKRYNRTDTIRDTDCLDDLLSLINTLSNQLKEKETEWWCVGREPLSNRLDMVHILNLRLCWCLALLIVNSRQDSTFGFADMAVEVLSVFAHDWWLHNPKPLFCRFVGVKDQITCLKALCETLHHETLVRLSDGRDNAPYWQRCPEILTIRYLTSADLTSSLQMAIRT
ncbi:UvrD/REP helicase amino-terminal domain protein [Rhizoctonia solani 123E]|uniref:UvrD/REP helicase amino-terminal domain protein n=1 Tax=Rhizoctonia solani 123E TaxID=1423351 RepID=A0A074RMX8_9AGAM|nr:UvrD/REP helicase amino-terminal domain protein [Rhizoctonia solani 123E]